MERLEEHPLLEPEEGVQVNISPLVDMVFLLLVFFMVTSVFSRQGALEVTLPPASSAPAAPAATLQITLTPQGGILFQGHPVDKEELPSLLKEALSPETRPILLLADQDCPTGLAVEILDLCRRAGASSLSLGTEGVRK
ncbi:MAG: ExbD/TolR family protein [Oligosphaeraceae bacterium]